MRTVATITIAIGELGPDLLECALRGRRRGLFVMREVFKVGNSYGRFVRTWIKVAGSAFLRTAITTIGPAPQRRLCQTVFRGGDVASKSHRLDSSAWMSGRPGPLADPWLRFGVCHQAVPVPIGFMLRSRLQSCAS